MNQSMQRAGNLARRPWTPNSAVTRRARLVAAFVLPGVVAFAPRAAQANEFVEFTWLAGFGKNGTTFEVPQSVAIDPLHGDFAVANTGAGRIEILAPDGRASVFFEHRVRLADGTTRPGQPRTVRFGPAGRLYVSDNLDSGVDILDFRGRVVGRLRLPKAGTATEPADTAAGALLPRKDGSVLVASRGENGRIHEFDAAGRWVRAWGEAGVKPGQLSRVSALAETPSGEIVVTCGATDLAVQRFDAAGNFIAGFGRHEMGPGNFSYPSGIAITADGRMWISDQLRQSVQVFDGKGVYLGVVGEGGPAPGSFLFPSDVATNGSDRLAVVERVGGRMQLFRVRDAEEMFRAPERR